MKRSHEDSIESLNPRPNKQSLVEITASSIDIFISKNPNLDTIKNLINQFGYDEINRYFMQNISVYTSSSMSLLQDVSANGSPEILKYFIEELNVLDTRNVVGGFVTIHYATIAGNIECLKYLIKKNANIDEVDNDNTTPLMFAARKGHTKIAELLISRGANIGASNIRGATPLMIAVQNGSTEIVKLLIDSGANIEAANIQGVTPLMFAAGNGHTEIVELLISSGANIEAVDNDNTTPLMFAAENGHTEIVELLIDSGANIEAANIQGVTPLMFAAGNGHTEIVKFLLSSGANIEAVDNNDTTPLMFAAENGPTEIVELLISSGANIEAVDNDNTTPLMFAARKGHTEIVKLLLSSGANIEAVDNNDTTTLTFAAQNGYTEIVKLLISSGANIEAVDNLGATPLMFAAENGPTEIAALLISSGANIEAVDNLGVTPLMFAAQYGHNEIVKLLIGTRANIEAANIQGATPLMFAAQYGHTEIVKLLIGTGANIDLTSPLGDMFLNANFDIAGFLLEHEDDINADEWKAAYPQIKNLLFGGSWMQKVISQDIGTSTNFEPFFLTPEAKDTLKDFLYHKINSATNYNAISIICYKLMESKKSAVDFMKALHATSDQEKDKLISSITALEDLFYQITTEIIEPLFGEYNNSQLQIPKLSLLTLSQVLSKVDDYKKFFEDNAWSQDLAKLSEKAKLLNVEQSKKVASALAALEEEQGAINNGLPSSYLGTNFNDEPMHEVAELLGGTVHPFV